MTLDNKPVRSGGCQCGAVRFRLEGAPAHSSVCHCRMCQKAFGALYAPLLNVGEATLTWTRGEPARFRSSSHVRRGFCSACGTPLTYEAPNGIALAIGAFDDPSDLAPSIQFGVEGKLPYVDRVPQLPVSTTDEDAASTQDSWMKEIRSFQHPDHDTPEP
ncbi:GFA family protein [Aureimonas jatrophae]|uniref:Uncharacterized conserved protein n=1 Tax=Aureimonas jatrophae TaxID=1166073 RepID=A0A1H0CXU4_9HYPH|nr:GFA family protein [Aureimonas jatrophae]MBB3949405.1 hypothetical protein [Aureimonas jatrophae]SDN62743.1 Uncharacterized conserved protein [Aureimonas jatrophae]